MRSVRQSGFTLIELMITVAIVAILAALAYPSYTRYIARSNRSAAQAQMMDIANREQQFLLSNRAYANKAALEASGYALPSSINGKYTYDIVVCPSAACPLVTVPSFAITFTGSGTQASDGALTLNSEGVKTPLSKW